MCKTVFQVLLESPSVFAKHQEKQVCLGAAEHNRHTVENIIFSFVQSEKKSKEKSAKPGGKGDSKSKNSKKQQKQTGKTVGKNSKAAKQAKVGKKHQYIQ